MSDHQLDTRRSARRILAALTMVMVMVPSGARAQTSWRDLTAEVPVFGTTINGIGPSPYAVSDTGDRGRTLTIRRVGPVSEQSDFGATGTVFDATALRGQRVRLRAMLQADHISGTGSTWLRVDGANGAMLSLENNMTRGVQGTTDWTEQRTILPVPDGATKIAFGVLLSGSGALHAKSLTIEVAPLPSADAPVAPEALRIVDSAIAIARAKSLWRDTVSWTPLAAQLRRALAGAESAEEAYPVVRMLVAALGDHHTVFMSPSGVEAMRTRSRGGAPASGSTTTSGNTTSSGEPDVVARMLAGERLGFLSIPAHGGFDEAASRTYVRRGREALVTQASQGACGWVVDLRLNGGGSMWPMIAVLAPFFGTDTLGSFISPSGSSPWTARGQYFSNDGMLDGMPMPARALHDAPVAVLLGRVTASSGEAVAISFRGRPSTRSFGEPTAGYTTGNAPFALPGGAMLYLTTTVEADRNGQRFGGKLTPDVEVTGDAVLEQAQAWLLAQPACSRAATP